MFCIYFVDFVADSLVSCIAMIDGGVWEYVISFCKHDIVVFNEEAFHIIACVS